MDIISIIPSLCLIVCLASKDLVQLKTVCFPSLLYSQATSPVLKLSCNFRVGSPVLGLTDNVEMLQLNATGYGGASITGFSGKLTLNAQNLWNVLIGPSKGKTSGHPGSWPERKMSDTLPKLYELECLTIMEEHAFILPCLCLHCP